MQGQSETVLGSRDKITTRIHTRKWSEAATHPAVARCEVLLQHKPVFFFSSACTCFDCVLARYRCDMPLHANVPLRVSSILTNEHIQKMINA